MSSLSAAAQVRPPIVSPTIKAALAASQPPAPVQGDGSGGGGGTVSSTPVSAPAPLNEVFKQEQITVALQFLTDLGLDSTEVDKDKTGAALMTEPISVKISRDGVTADVLEDIKSVLVSKNSLIRVTDSDSHDAKAGLTELIDRFKPISAAVFARVNAGVVDSADLAIVQGIVKSFHELFDAGENSAAVK